MIRSITESQKRRIKELVDELIINRGVLNTKSTNIGVDGLNTEQLTGLAFRYYKMIMKGESPLDIDLRVDKPQNDVIISISDNVKKCIGCNQPLSDNELREKMPVCEACRKKIKVDFDILREIFH